MLQLVQNNFCLNPGGGGSGVVVVVFKSKLCKKKKKHLFFSFLWHLFIIIWILPIKFEPWNIKKNKT